MCFSSKSRELKSDLPVVNDLRPLVERIVQNFVSVDLQYVAEDDLVDLFLFCDLRTRMQTATVGENVFFTGSVFF